MMKKIYNKKGFCSGIISLTIVLFSVLVGIKCGYRNTGSLIKSIILISVLTIIGITSIYRSMNKDCTKEDIKNNDEREELINLKAGNSALNFSTNFCFCSMIIIVLLWVKFRWETLITIIIVMAVILDVLLISPIVAYYYHNKNN